MPCGPFADAEGTAHNAARMAITIDLRIGGTSVSGWENRCAQHPRAASSDGSARVKRALLRRNVSVTRVDEAVDGVRDEPGGGHPEQPLAVARMRELLQRSVEPDRLP